MNSNGNGQLIPGIRKVAIVFDDQTRPETTGVYCRRALERLAEVTRVQGSGFAVQVAEVQFFHPSQLADVPRSGFDLYLNIDDGMRYLWPADLRPAAWWAIDTHIDFGWCLTKAKGFDLVFAAQRDGAALLRQEGVESARWLPLACDAEVHATADRAHRRGPHSGPPPAGEGEYDVCFVGNLFPGPRTDLVRLIQQRFKNVYVGQAYFEEMAAIYARSRIVFNRSVANDVNMRVFEALASGSLLMTNDLREKGDGYVLPERPAGCRAQNVPVPFFRDNGLSELFRDGVHLATYRDSAELLDKLAYYLRHDDVREKIAAAGRAEVLAKHTYRQRIEEILSRAQGGSQLSVVRGPLQLTTNNGQRAPEPIQNRKSKIQNPAPSYYEFARPEVLELIPLSARRVLEIGCGAGRLGEALKQRQPCEVAGVELHGPAAEQANERLDRVIVGDVERLEAELEAESRGDSGAPPQSGSAAFGPTGSGSFDCLVCADVLEHLADPASFLRQARGWLTDDATIVASIPNARHHSVVGGLIEGNWTYEPAGLLDNTHLHFFTRRDVEELFTTAGYRLEKMQFVPGAGYDDWQRQSDKSRVQLGRVLVTDLPRDAAEEFFVYQFLLVARPEKGDSYVLPERPGGCCAQNEAVPFFRPNPKSKIENPKSSALPRCLLLMVTYNRLEYTRLALEAVLELDYPNLRIVVWDNASTDGTVDYLRERLAGVSHAKLIASPVNRGVVFPMNEAWSSNPQARLLAKIDNDTLVPPDLLRRLAECHLQSEKFGVLSGFHFRQEGEALAEEHRIKTFDGVRVLPQPYVGGCAVMIRRDVFERVGQIGCRQDGPQQQPFMDSGWTLYQQRLSEAGLINGYPWPPIHVDHMEDTRSPHCIRSQEHQQYKRQERGMGLEEFTRELCVWRPNWEPRVAEVAKFPAPGITDVVKFAEQSHRDGRTMSGADGPHPSPPLEGEGVMRFRQDFIGDFEQFDFWGRPFAFARFADGERAICMGTPIKGQDGWSFDGRQAEFTRQLNEALRYDAPGYYVGISDGCCDRPAKEWYLQQIRLPPERVTFSNIFVNANYRRFREIDSSEMAIVASEGGDYWVPEDLMNSNFDLDRLVERLLGVDRPILVSAGPASCIIIHKYWQRAVKKQVIVDIGSAIDERTKGRQTRQYQVPGTRTAELVCRW